MKLKKLICAVIVAVASISCMANAATIEYTNTYTVDDLSEFAQSWKSISNAKMTVDSASERIQIVPASTGEGTAYYPIVKGVDYKINFVYKMNNLGKFGFILSDDTVLTIDAWDNGSTTAATEIIIDFDGKSTITHTHDSKTLKTVEFDASVTGNEGKYIKGLYAYEKDTNRKISIYAPFSIKAVLNATDASYYTDPDVVNKKGFYGTETLTGGSASLNWYINPGNDSWLVNTNPTVISGEAGAEVSFAMILEDENASQYTAAYTLQ